MMSRCKCSSNSFVLVDRDVGHRPPPKKMVLTRGKESLFPNATSYTCPWQHVKTGNSLLDEYNVNTSRWEPVGRWSGDGGRSATPWQMIPGLKEQGSLSWRQTRVGRDGIFPFVHNAHKPAPKTATRTATRTFLFPRPVRWLLLFDRDHFSTRQPFYLAFIPHTISTTPTPTNTNTPYPTPGMANTTSA